MNLQQKILSNHKNLYKSCAFFGGWAFSRNFYIDNGFVDYMKNQYEEFSLYSYEDYISTGTQIPQNVDRLIGWSLGGFMLLEELLEQSYDIRIDLIASSVKFTSSNNYKYGVNPRALKAMKLAVSKNPNLILEKFYQDCLVSSKFNFDLMTSKHFCQNKQMLLKGLSYFQSVDLRAKLSNLRSPVNLFLYDGDIIVNSNSVNDIGCRLVISKILTGGHMSLFEECA